MSTVHEIEVAYAERLTTTQGTDEVYAILKEVLTDHCGTTLDETDLDYVCDSLTNIVAFAKTRSFQRGMEIGDLERRRSVARALGLGRIEPEKTHS